MTAKTMQLSDLPAADREKWIGSPVLTNMPHPAYLAEIEGNNAHLHLYHSQTGEWLYNVWTRIHDVTIRTDHKDTP